MNQNNGVYNPFNNNQQDINHQVKTKQISLSIVGIAILVIGLVGITYAFFNYTRTGTSNTIRVGKVYFNTEQNGNINLTNVYPIEANSANLSDPTKVGMITIDITGDTIYDDGVEYVVSAVNVNNEINGKHLPISINVSYGETSGETIGTPDNNYFTNRGGATSLYKILAKDTINENDYLVVGYIAKGAAGIDGTVTIKAYIDEDKIVVTDTYPSGNVTHTEGSNEVVDYTNLTTDERVDGRVVFTTSEWNSLHTSGISFRIKVEANEGIWVEEQITALDQITQNVITPVTPINFANMSSSNNGEGLYILPGTESDSNPIYYYRGNINNNNVIFGDYCWQMVRTTDTGGIKMIYNGEITGTSAEPTCENTLHVDRIIGDGAFNSQYNTVSDIGYMRNARYAFTNAAGDTGAIYGKNVEWNGTSYLVIDDTSGTASVNTTKDNYHHYSCGTSNETTCSEVRYYYFEDYYITLSNGEKVEDALYKMTGNGSADVLSRNTSYVLNQNDSTIKATTENWFETNLTNEIDSTKRDYRPYLEDTIFCNDRSFKTVTGGLATFESSGWNPNGGDLTKNLFFGSINRVFNNWYSDTNVPVMECVNNTDKFSMSNSLARLNYPIGFLTADEMILAGASAAGLENESYYLFTGDNYWTASPSDFYLYAREISIYNGGLSRYNGVGSGYGIRPVISLKLGVKFENGGDGTPTNPYIVKYN